MTDLKVQIWTDWGSGSALKIVFWRWDGSKVHLYNFFTQKATTINEGDTYPDEYILKVPGTMRDELFRSLAEAMDKQGIKTENDHKIAGILEATKYHLEDLRKIAKLK